MVWHSMHAKKQFENMFFQYNCINNRNDLTVNAHNKSTSKISVSIQLYQKQKWLDIQCTQKSTSKHMFVNSIVLQEHKLLDIQCTQKSTSKHTCFNTIVLKHRNGSTFNAHKRALLNICLSIHLYKLEVAWHSMHTNDHF